MTDGDRRRDAAVGTGVDRDRLTRREALSAATAVVAGATAGGLGARQRPDGATVNGTSPTAVALIGHRGCADQYPENTVAALEASAPHVDAVEIDVRRCGSGELVVFHDERLDRLTSATGRVADTSWADLRDLTVLDSGEPIPRLAAALAAVPADAAINVELKGRGLAADVIETADTADNDVFYSSFAPADLEAVSDEAPDADRALLVSDAAAGRAVRTAGNLGCSAVHPDAESVTPRFVELAHRAGLAVNAWTIDDHATAKALLAAGVDGLIVDRWDVLETDRATADRAP